MAMPGNHFLIETEGSSEDDGKGNADADIILQESRLKMRTINNYLDKDYSLKYLSGVGGRMKNRVLAVDANNTEFRCCGGNCPDNFINYQLCLVRCKGPDCFIHDDDR